MTPADIARKLTKAHKGNCHCHYCMRAFENWLERKDAVRAELMKGDAPPPA